MSHPTSSPNNPWRSRLTSFAIVLSLLAGYGLTTGVSTVTAGAAVPFGVGIVPVVDAPATQFSHVDGGRRGGQAARIEVDDTSRNAGLSAWYRLAYVDGGTRLQVFEHYSPTTLGPDADIALSQQTAWMLANEAVGPYGESTDSRQVPDWAHVHTGNNSGPSAGLIFVLTYIDLLTRGRLVGDLRVAGTGVIGDDGAVLPVSNVEVKVATALLAHPDVILTPRPSKLVDRTTIIEPEHTRKPADGEAVAEWLKLDGYQQAGREAANHPGTTAFVVVHDYRQALAFFCGRTGDPTVCSIARARRQHPPHNCVNAQPGSRAR